MNITRTRSLYIEVYKTLNYFNLEVMKNLSRLRVTNRIQREICKFNVEIPKSNQVTFGIRYRSMQGPKV